EEKADFTIYGGPSCGELRQAIQNNFVGGKLYGLDKDGYPRLVDPETGEAVWTADEPGQPLTFADGLATYAVDSETEVKAVDVASGENVWKWDYGSMNLAHDFLEPPLESTPIGHRYGGDGDYIL